MSTRAFLRLDVFSVVVKEQIFSLMLGSFCESGVIWLTILRTPPRSDPSVPSQSLHHNMPTKNIFEKQFGSPPGSCPRVQTNAVRTALVLQSVNEVLLKPGSVGVSTRDRLSLVVFSFAVDWWKLVTSGWSFFLRAQQSDPSACCRPVKLSNKLKRNILFGQRALTEIGAVAVFYVAKTRKGIEPSRSCQC